MKKTTETWVLDREGDVGGKGLALQNCGPRWGRILGCNSGFEREPTWRWDARIMVGEFGELVI